MNCFVFDIETVPDVELGRRLLGRSGDSDAEIAEALFAARREQTGSDFLPFEMHRIVAISAALRSRDHFNVWSLGEPDSSEEAADSICRCCITVR
jgi:3'-5' exonuclease